MRKSLIIALVVASLLVSFSLAGCSSGLSEIRKNFVIFPDRPTAYDETYRTSRYWSYYKHYQGQHPQIPMYEGVSPP